MNRAHTTALDILTAMAYRREQFKDRVEEKLGGALLEHYKAVLARLSRQTRWVQHWEREADRLVRQELPVVGHEKHRPVVVGQRPHDHIFCSDVQVVGRLIQYDG